MKIIVLLSSLLLILVEAKEMCSLVSSQPYGYTGDVSGKRVYTKEEFTYKCTNKISKIGSCKKWKEKYQEFDISKLKRDVYYESEKFQGSIGKVLGAAQAYDKINGLWSGWHGLCQDGADDGNWDWASDPYVLAGFAITAVSGTAAGSAEKGATKAAIEASKQTIKYATCAARAGLDTARMMQEYQKDGEPCDFVDEFCDEEESTKDDGNIFTVPEAEYNQMVNNNPDLIKSIKIIDGIGTGVLTLKVINAGVNTKGMSSQKAQKAMKEAKKLALKIKAALATLQLATCMMVGDTGGASSNTVSSLLSAKNIASMALYAVNPFVGLAVDVLSRVYDSMLTKIDTCNNEDDAKKKGSRHEATYHAVPNKLCHKIEIIEKGDKLLNTAQRKHRFCCYDDKTTRILVEQAKAQFAKDWQHCTDITLKELEVISFNTCNPTELDAGIDGTKLPADAKLSQRMKAYQFTHKCIDTREFITTLLEKFAGEDLLIDTSDAKRILEELK